MNVQTIKAGDHLVINPEVEGVIEKIQLGIDGAEGYIPHLNEVIELILLYPKILDDSEFAIEFLQSLTKLRNDLITIATGTFYTGVTCSYHADPQLVPGRQAPDEEQTREQPRPATWEPRVINFSEDD